jgi:hypothetical protein
MEPERRRRTPASLGRAFVLGERDVGRGGVDRPKSTCVCAALSAAFSSTTETGWVGISVLVSHYFPERQEFTSRNGGRYMRTRVFTAKHSQE